MGVVTLEESGSEFKSHWQESTKFDSSGSYEPIGTSCFDAAVSLVRHI